MNQNGIYIGTTPTGTTIKEVLRYKRAKFVSAHPNQEALETLFELKVKIDKSFCLLILLMLTPTLKNKEQ